MPYELPEPAKKLKPTIWKISLIAGMDCAILSIFFVTTAVRFNPEAGGKIILAKITPWSSLGTKLDGVVFIRITKVVAKSAMPVKTIHFLPARKPTELLYFLTTVST